MPSFVVEIGVKREKFWNRTKKWKGLRVSVGELTRSARNLQRDQLPKLGGTASCQDRRHGSRTDECAYDRRAGVQSRRQLALPKAGAIRYTIVMIGGQKPMGLKGGAPLRSAAHQ